MTGAEDRAIVALLFCATFGVGSMSFGSVFAAAGPLLASLAVYLLSACNLHARCVRRAHLVFHDRHSAALSNKSHVASRACMLAASP